MVLLITYLLLALVVSFLCSIMESVLLSTPHSFLVVEKEAGHIWPSMFMQFKENIDKPLSAILSLNTVAHTVGAAGVGAEATKIYGEEAFGIISAILTILILLITEIIPKTLGARYWRKLSQPSAYLIRASIFISYPLVFISSYITKWFSSTEKEQTTSREEIAALASIGAIEGVFTAKEDKIIQNVLKLKNLKVKEIMTPRVVVALANENMTLEEFLHQKEFLRFSRIPIFQDNDENLTGYVIREEVFEHLAEGKGELQLKNIKRNIIVTPSSTVIFSMWEQLLEKKEHIAMIVDEYGGLDGIVTMEDIIETLLGLEIVDERDTEIDMQEYARKRWKAKQAKYNYLNDSKQSIEDEEAL